MAKEGNQNALGNEGGRPRVDRTKSARLRGLAIDKMLELLEMPTVKMKADDYDLYKQVLVKLAGGVLPRLQEITGEGGGPVELSLSVADKKKLNAILNGEAVEQESNGDNDSGDTSPESVSSKE